jgi:hypothetical protein
VHNRSNVNRNRAHQKKARERTRNVNRAHAPGRYNGANERRARSHHATGAHRRAHFNNQQRTRMRNYYRGHRHHFHRVAHVTWPIVVGGFVPRDYTLYAIPDDFYGYVPGYEGYKYIVVGDELVIIDPDTWEIVAVIPL